MARTLPLLLVGAGLGLGALVVLSRRDPAPLGAPQPTPPLAPPSGPAGGAASPTQGRDTVGRVVDLGIDLTRDLSKVLLNNRGTGVQDPPPPPPEPEPPTPTDQELLESRGVKRESDGRDIVVD